MADIPNHIRVYFERKWNIFGSKVNFCVQNGAADQSAEHQRLRNELHEDLDLIIDELVAQVKRG